jgi:uroporphyrinogen-III decarboxylase
MVWTAGPFMNPDFYRKVIFPRYRELWRPLREAGKKVLYCSDGDFSMFLDDVADAGADGFIFEPVVPLEEVCRRFGGTHVIVGSKVDCRTLTFGDKDDVRREVDETLSVARECPGYIFAVGNHIPENCKIENLVFLFDYLMSRWGRDV